MGNLWRNVKIVSKLIGESMDFALTSLKGDKFRAFLSLLGVTIGIFSIIAVFQAVDSLESNVRDGFSVFGSDLVYVNKYPWEDMEGGPIKFWEYRQRPNNKYEEYEYLKENLSTAAVLAFRVSWQGDVKNGRNYVKNTDVHGITSDWDKILPFKLSDGRYFNLHESASAQPVAIIGTTLADELFPGQDPINQTIKLGGYTVRVIGVIQKVGASMFSMIEYDTAILCPLNFMRNLVDFRRISPDIVVLKKPEVSQDDFKGEIRMYMRNIRRLKPVQKDDFALNNMSFLQDALGEIFGVLNSAGAIIGGFSIIIGAFGIANIMFVSVKERTPQIGIQKAMGAKSYFILSQFLAESIILALMGGVLGILIVYVLSILVSNNLDFNMVLSWANVLRGVLISSVVGIVAGFIPAYQAAHLNPVDAINQH